MADKLNHLKSSVNEAKELLKKVEKELGGTSNIEDRAAQNFR